MIGKCPVCGAPMQENGCEYCGYSEKKPTNTNSNFQPQPQMPMQQPTQPQMPMQQPPQPQVVINHIHQNSFDFIPGVSRKSKVVALLLCIFFGYLGAHKFYVGKIGIGILYLLTMGFFGIGWLIDIILIAVGAFRDEFDLPLKR